MSFIDHGATPPSTLAARNTATTGAPLRACVAGSRARVRPLCMAATSRAASQFLDSRSGDRAQGRVVVGCGGADRRSLAGDRRTRSPASGTAFTPRPARDPPVSDGVGTGSRRRAHLDDPRGRNAARDSQARRASRRCRSTSTAPSRRCAATSACPGHRQRAPHHFTRAGHQRPGAGGRTGTPAAQMRQINPKNHVYDGPSERRLPERRK